MGFEDQDDQKVGRGTDETYNQPSTREDYSVREDVKEKGQASGWISNLLPNFFVPFPSIPALS
jgi:hypothetical protein